MLPIAAAYRMQKGGLHDAVKGCIINPAQEKACGALMLDTGAAPGSGGDGKLGREPAQRHGRNACFFGEARSPLQKR